MSKKLIVFAQRGEAEATLHALNAQSVESETRFVWSEGEIPSLYEFEQGRIVISSVGIHAAQMAVAKYAPDVDEVWNIGLSGALQSGLPIGEILEIEKVGKYIPFGSLDSYSLECLRTTVPHLTLSNGGGKLISSDFPIHDRTHRFHLGKTWDLVDMEGYGVAYASRQLGKKCKMWKIVSDFASPGGRELIRKNRTRLSEQIAETLYAAIHESRPHSSFPRNRKS
ncbi:MAG: hypothetical protein JJU12_08340 [Chlamydiales bacterium]|nr:hypothetical protein [Chlamydiales bacterium]